MDFHIDKSIQLKPEEEVLEVVHEDVVPHLPRFLLLFLWFVIPFFFLFPLFRQGAVGVVIFFALVGSALVFSFRDYLRWSNTMLVITDRRIIDVERRAFFERVVSEIPYARVDDVTYRVKGLVPTLFRYGDVRVHAAGSGADIEFRRVARPSRVHDLIHDLRDAPASRAERSVPTHAHPRERDAAIERFMSGQPDA